MVQPVHCSVTSLNCLLSQADANVRRLPTLGAVSAGEEAGPISRSAIPALPGPSQAKMTQAAVAHATAGWDPAKVPMASSRPFNTLAVAGLVKAAGERMAGAADQPSSHAAAFRVFEGALAKVKDLAYPEATGQYQPGVEGSHKYTKALNALESAVTKYVAVVGADKVIQDVFTSTVMPAVAERVVRNFPTMQTEQGAWNGVESASLRDFIQPEHLNATLEVVQGGLGRLDNEGVFSAFHELLKIPEFVIAPELSTGPAEGEGPAAGPGPLVEGQGAGPAPDRVAHYAPVNVTATGGNATAHSDGGPVLRDALRGANETSLVLANGLVEANRNQADLLRALIGKCIALPTQMVDVSNPKRAGVTVDLTPSVAREIAHVANEQWTTHARVTHDVQEDRSGAPVTDREQGALDAPAAVSETVPGGQDIDSHDGVHDNPSVRLEDGRAEEGSEGQISWEDVVTDFTSGGVRGNFTRGGGLSPLLDGNVAEDYASLLPDEQDDRNWVGHERRVQGGGNPYLGAERVGGGRIDDEAAILRNQQRIEINSELVQRVLAGTHGTDALGTEAVIRGPLVRHASTTSAVSATSRVSAASQSVPVQVDTGELGQLELKDLWARNASINRNEAWVKSVDSGSYPPMPIFSAATRQGWYGSSLDVDGQDGTTADANPFGDGVVGSLEARTYSLVDGLGQTTEAMDASHLRSTQRLAEYGTNANVSGNADAVSGGGLLNADHDGAQHVSPRSHGISGLAPDGGRGGTAWAAAQESSQRASANDVPAPAHTGALTGLKWGSARAPDEGGHRVGANGGAMADFAGLATATGVVRTNASIGHRGDATQSRSEAPSVANYAQLDDRAGIERATLRATSLSAAIAKAGAPQLTPLTSSNGSVVGAIKEAGVQTAVLLPAVALGSSHPYSASGRASLRNEKADRTGNGIDEFQTIWGRIRSDQKAGVDRAVGPSEISGDASILKGERSAIDLALDGEAMGGSDAAGNATARADIASAASLSLGTGGSVRVLDGSLREGILLDSKAPGALHTRTAGAVSQLVDPLAAGLIKGLGSEAADDGYFGSVSDPLSEVRMSSDTGDGLRDAGQDYYRFRNSSNEGKFEILPKTSLLMRSASVEIETVNPPASLTNT